MSETVYEGLGIPKTPAERIDLIMQLAAPLRDETGRLISGPVITKEQARSLLNMPIEESFTDEDRELIASVRAGRRPRMTDEEHAAILAAPRAPPAMFTDTLPTGADLARAAVILDERTRARREREERAIERMQRIEGALVRRFGWMVRAYRFLRGLRSTLRKAWYDADPRISFRRRAGQSEPLPLVKRRPMVQP